MRTKNRQEADGVCEAIGSEIKGLLSRIEELADEYLETGSGDPEKDRAVQTIGGMSHLLHDHIDMWL